MHCSGISSIHIRTRMYLYENVYSVYLGPNVIKGRILIHVTCHAVTLSKISNRISWICTVKRIYIIENNTWGCLVLTQRIYCISVIEGTAPPLRLPNIWLNQDEGGCWLWYILYCTNKSHLMRSKCTCCVQYNVLKTDLALFYYTVMTGKLLPLRSTGAETLTLV